MTLKKTKKILNWIFSRIEINKYVASQLSTQISDVTAHCGVNYLRGHLTQ